MERLSASDFAAMLGAAAALIGENEPRLTELDSKLGDGDHGTTMVKVMGLVSETAASRAGGDFKTLLADVGAAVLGVGGGATVPLFGSLFSGMSRRAPEGDVDADAETLCEMFASGTERLLKFSKAAVGDKTLVDALLPAVAAMTAARGEGIARMLEAAADAAEAGSESTKQMTARHGRAKNLGDRVVGFADPGSVSVALLFRAFSDKIREAEK